MAPMAIPEGYDLLPTRSRSNARKAIALAEERGYSSEVVLSRSDGYLIPLGVAEAVAEEIVFPDPVKANHTEIDTFAGSVDVTYDGIEAADAEKPTKAEKVAHIKKIVTERAEQNSDDLENTGSGGGLTQADGAEQNGD